MAESRSALGVQNSNRPRPGCNGEVTADIVTNGQLSRAEDYQPLVIGYDQGAAVRLADVADVSDSVQNVRAAGYLNGERAVTLVIFRQPGANIIDTVDRIRDAMPYIHTTVPKARLNHRPRSHHDDPRVGRRRSVDARVSPSRWSSSWC